LGGRGGLEVFFGPGVALQTALQSQRCLFARKLFSLTSDPFPPPIIFLHTHLTRSAPNFAEAMRMGTETYHVLKGIIEKKYGACEEKVPWPESDHACIASASTQPHARQTNQNTLHNTPQNQNLNKRPRRRQRRRRGRLCAADRHVRGRLGPADRGDRGGRLHGQGARRFLEAVKGVGRPPLLAPHALPPRRFFRCTPPSTTSPMAANPPPPPKKTDQDRHGPRVVRVLLGQARRVRLKVQGGGGQRRLGAQDDVREDGCFC
jgi:hypothetical protein